MKKLLIRYSLCFIATFMLLCGQTACSNEKREKNPASAKEKEDMPERTYPGASSRMVYIPQEEPVLQQWSREGKKQKTIALPVKKYGGTDQEYNLLWVNDDEILWSVYADGEKYKNMYTTIVLSTPVRQTASGEEVMLGQTKELFTIKEEEDLDLGGLGDSLEEPGITYADKEKIYFFSEGDLYEYDRTAKKGPFAVESPDGKKHSWGAFSARIQGKTMIYHTGRTAGKLEEHAYEFWIYDLETKERKRIDDRCYTNAAYVTDPEGSRVWYQITDDQSIWEYDCVTGDKKELVSEKEFQKCYGDNQLSWDEGYYDDLLFMEGERLYYIKDREDPVIFSCSVRDRKIVYEKALTEAVRRSGYRDTDEGTLSMAAGKMLLTLSDENMEVCNLCIDLKTAEIRPVDSEDAEIIYFGMLGEWYDDAERKSWKETDGEKKENDHTADVHTAETIEEQLALISRQSDVWLEIGDDTEGMGYYYAVTDLDHNGRLEVIVSTGSQGSGGFTSSKYYQVSLDGTKLRRVYAGGGSADVDIVSGGADKVESIETAYVDPKTDTWYYNTYDYMSGGAGARYVSYAALVLRHGLLTTCFYASGECSWNKKKTDEVWQYFYYPEGEEKKVKAKNFDPDALAEKFFKGFDKKKVKISWFYLGSGKKPSEKKLKKLVEKSGRGFQVSEMDS